MMWCTVRNTNLRTWKTWISVLTPISNSNPNPNNNNTILISRIHSKNNEKQHKHKHEQKTYTNIVQQCQRQQQRNRRCTTLHGTVYPPSQLTCFLPPPPPLPHSSILSTSPLPPGSLHRPMSKEHSPLLMNVLGRSIVLKSLLMAPSKPMISRRWWIESASFSFNLVVINLVVLMNFQL